MDMQLSKTTWVVLVVISLGIAYLVAPDHDIAAAIGGALGMLVAGWLILGLVILVGKVFKTPPSRTTRRGVFLSIWTLAVLGQLQQLGRRPQATHAELITQCMQAARDSAGYDIGAAMDLEEYCECALGKMMERGGFDRADVRAMRDRNSVLFNELIMTCFAAAQHGQVGHMGMVMGMNESDTIPVMNTERGIKVKMTVGNEASYFLFDSGASDIMVSASFEEVMRKNGTIQGYLQNMSYQLANGALIDCRRAIVNDIQIGEFLVDSAVVAIYDGDIEYLLGKSFLDKFTSWTFTERGNNLILVK